MAPNGEMLVGSYSRNFIKPQKLPTVDGLQRAMSDLSFELSREAIDAKLPPISEVEDAKCECCGLSEECTPEYIRLVRGKFSGKWICGLCSEAVKQELGKNGGRHEEALDAHMSACARFNRIGRSHPILYQADAMREILRKCSRGGARAKSISPRDNNKIVKTGGITRTSSCISAFTEEINERAELN